MIETNKIYCMDCREGLKKIEDNSIDCIITSPPYWALRKYTDDNPNEIGCEEHPKDYINKIVNVCVECMRVLKPNGNFFLNIGDSYATHKSGKDTEINKSNKKKLKSLVIRNSPKKSLKSNWFQEKQKLLIPHRIAIALQDRGYIVRDDNVWVKKLTLYPEKESLGTTMPFPVKDRFLSSTEYIFHIVKNKNYYFNLEKVKLNLKESSIKRAQKPISSTFKRQVKNNPYLNHNGMENYYNKLAKKYIDDNNGARMTRTKVGLGNVKNWNPQGINVETANPTNAIMFKRRNQFSKKGFDEHYATFPEVLVDLFIKVGCREKGIVLDPFAGVGTTLVVAKYSGRNFIGFEINQDYIKIANRRLAQKTLSEVEHER